MNKGYFTRKKMDGGWVTAEPKPSSAELAAFYHDQYYQDEAVRPKSYQATYDDQEIAHKQLRAGLCLYALRVQDPAAGTGKRLLDVGCGEGYLLAAAAKLGWDVAGIDFSRHGVATFNPEMAERVRTGDAYQLLSEITTAREKFDACVLTNVIEHVIDPEKMLHDVRRVMRPGGTVAITLPNDYSPLQELALELGHIDRDFWFAPPQHLHYFNAETGSRFARQCGFELRDIFSSFPIDFYLFHPGSNYVADPDQGRAAHRAQIALDLLMAGQGLEKYHRLAQAMADCGVGRSITMILGS